MTKIFVAGQNGMVGSAICRQLQNQDVELVTASRQELDLTNQVQVKEFFERHKFDQVYLAAAKVGGINANNVYPAEFIYQNLMIQTNVIHNSYCSGVDKLLFLGSSCIYPKFASQPIKESELLQGYLEETNEPYAISKIAGIKMCESYNRQYGTDYRSVMPTNLYGPGDNYHPENSHVIPALIKKIHDAKVKSAQKVIVWGTGSALREFLFVDDLAYASVFLMNLPKEKYKKEVSEMSSHINIGSGEELSIKGLVNLISDITGYRGAIEWDQSKPDGTPRKLLDNTKLESFGWVPEVNIRSGLEITYDDYVKNPRT